MHLIVLLMLLSQAATAAIEIVTSTTDLAWGVEQIGGDRVKVTSLLSGHENPHYADAVPAFIQRVSKATAVCLIGLELEVGWLPRVLSRSGNADVQPGGQGYCETGSAVTVLEKPSGPIDRSQGDVHPAGNPHYWLSPKHFAQGLSVVLATLSRIDPAGSSVYQKRYETLKKRLEDLHARNLRKLAPITSQIKSTHLIEYHKEFSYFLEAYGLKSAGSIEEKPGVPPSAGRLAQVALSSRQAGVKLVLATDTSPRKTLERFHEMSGIPILILPVSLQSGKFWDYEALQVHAVDELLKKLKTGDLHAGPRT